MALAVEVSGPYRDGTVHVLDDKCSTCVFRPGNLMHLEPGRLSGMVKAGVDRANRPGGAITCHSTIYRDDVEPAVCRGFYDKHRDRVQALQVAERLSMVTYDPQPPPQGEG